MNLFDIIPFLSSSGLNVPPYPKNVIIETTNACNLRCTMCHIWGEGVKKQREVGFISENLWRKAIDELSHWDEPVNLTLHGAGEPILHKDFLKILAYATSKKNLSAGFLSNGSLWSGDLSKAILDTNIAWIGFSIDGADPEAYKKYRGADLKRIESVIENLIAQRKNKRPFIFLNMVALPDLDVDRFITRWIDKVDEIKISTYRPIGHRDFLKDTITRVPCYLLNEMLVVAWNGKAVLCCEDIWAENIVGHFPDKSLLDIWRSATFDRLRRLHRRGKYEKIELCRNCDAWSNIFTDVELDESRNVKIVKSAAQVCYSRIEKQK